MNETFDRYWKWFNEKFIRLQMKSRYTHDDLQNLKQMRKEREMLINYIYYRGYEVDANNIIFRRFV